MERAVQALESPIPGDLTAKPWGCGTWGQGLVAEGMVGL